jgi:hypothetical protein
MRRLSLGPEPAGTMFTSSMVTMRGSAATPLTKPPISWYVPTTTMLLGTSA